MSEKSLYQNFTNEAETERLHLIIERSAISAQNLLVLLGEENITLSPQDLNKAAGKLDILNKTWRKFYFEALADGNDDVAQLVATDILTQLGFDPDNPEE